MTEPDFDTQRNVDATQAIDVLRKVE